MTTLADVKQYWSTHVNDIEVVSAPVGSPEFLAQMEQYRYEKMPYLKGIVTAPDYRGKELLEIGCGPGIDSVQLATAGARFNAVDLTPQAVSLTRQHLALRGLTGNVQEANAEQLPFPADTFDIVYSHGVLHHTVNTEGAIAEVRRVLKPGGRAIIMLYHSRSWFWWLSKWTRTPVEHADADAPIVRAYTIPEIEKMFAAFRTVRVTTERFPVKTLKFKGLKGTLFNQVFVPVFNALPTSLTGRLGWHLMIWAEK
jgi:ubiquinone/menaquinone biosynthesis C-methylase UbiE